MSIKIEVTGAKVSFKKWAFKPMAATWRSRVAPQVLAALKEEAPVYKYDDKQLSRGQKVGGLRDSIKLNSMGGSFGEGISMVFISDVPYAKYVITGTRPHPINAVNSPLLHWERGGIHTYRKSVWHKGTTANNFPQRAIEKVKPVIGRELELTVSEFLKPTQL